MKKEDKNRLILNQNKKLIYQMIKLLNKKKSRGMKMENKK